MRTWLFGILYNKIAEARRDLGRKHQTDDIDDVIQQRFDPQGSWVRPPHPVDVQLYGAEIRSSWSSSVESLVIPRSRILDRFKVSNHTRGGYGASDVFLNLLNKIMSSLHRPSSRNLDMD